METISVVIPIYNGEQYLRECIDSVLAQTYPAAEVILVDDGSEDGSSQICREYASVHDHVIYVRQPNGGALQARATGVKLAHGTWVNFVDADDTLPLEALQNLLALATDETDIVVGNVSNNRYLSPPPVLYIGRISQVVCFREMSL